MGQITDMGRDPQHAFIHCSPFLTRRKDINKSKIILETSFPHVLSLNEQVDKDFLDNLKFLLKFPSVDDIVEEIYKQDASLPKFDVARGFRHICVDPVDALKLDINVKMTSLLTLWWRWAWSTGPQCLNTKTVLSHIYWLRLGQECLPSR